MSLVHHLAAAIGMTAIFCSALGMQPLTSGKAGVAAVKPSAASTPRLAILNFGAPSSWQGRIGNGVGDVITAKAFHEAIPLLERDGVTDVIIRLHSGGGLGLEVERFHDVFEKEYKPRFRTVAWIESAISAAAMSPWVLEEFYFLPEGNIGACVGWRGNLEEVTGPEREQMLIKMEEASRLGKRDERIMRSMQIADPLSCNIDENGMVSWSQDLSGANIVNAPPKILTLTANEAMKYRVGKAIAATPEELARAMGYGEFTFGGRQAAKFIDDAMTANDTAEKKFNEYMAKYRLHLDAARQTQQRDKRMVEVGLARKDLAEMREAVKRNPNTGLLRSIDDAWFKQQEEMLKQLSK